MRLFPFDNGDMISTIYSGCVCFEDTIFMYNPHISTSFSGILCPKQVRQSDENILTV